MKPVIKTSDGRGRLAEWVVEKFPPEYRDMTYVEPFLGDGSVFLAKDASREEVLSDPDFGVVNLWRALRDEHRLLVSRLKKVKYSESAFRRHQSLKDHEDYLSAAVSEFLLRQMSKSGLKRSFVPRSDDTDCRRCWKGLFDMMDSLEGRIRDSFFLCRDALELLRAFNNEKTLVYCDAPAADGEFMTADRHAELGSFLKDFRGKVVVVGPNSSLYRRMYEGWNRRGLPGNQKESVWVNF